MIEHKIKFEANTDVPMHVIKSADTDLHFADDWLHIATGYVMYSIRRNDVHVNVEHDMSVPGEEKTQMFIKDSAEKCIIIICMDYDEHVSTVQFIENHRDQYANEIVSIDGKKYRLAKIDE